MSAQNCQQADTSIVSLPILAPVSKPVQAFEQWVEFKPDSAMIRIIISSYSDLTWGHVHRAVLFNGPCSNLVQITNDYMTFEGDTVLLIYARNLTPGETYHLRLEFDIDTTGLCSKCGIGDGFYDISIENLSGDFIIPGGVCPEICPNNMAFNGGFESGYTGFFTGGTFHPCNQQNLPAFHHGVCNNANDLHLNWASPPRSGSLALFVDDPENITSGPNIIPEQYIWSREVDIVPNTNYCFNGYFRNIVSPNCSGCTILPDVFIGIFGNLTGDQNSLASTGPLAIQGPWTFLEYYWNSGPNTRATFYFYSDPNGSGSTGNDVGIDDVSIHGRHATPLIIASPSTVICLGQQVTLTAQSYSANPSFTWSTGATTQSIQVSPTATTTYFVTHDDGCGSISNQIVIHVIPTFSVLVSPAAACMGTTIQFTNNTFPFSTSTWSWNFGDPSSGANNTSTLANPSHIFSGPGNYQVTLTANTSQCGVFTHTQSVQVVPSTPNYNPNCCSANQSLYTDNSILINAAPLPVTTWNAQNKVIQFNLEVLPGATLIIQNSLIQFGPTGKLIVHPQAKVIVDNATLRGLLSCGTMWMGVEVSGNATKNQYQVDINGNIFHGKFILRNSSFIIDAHNGIISARASGAFFNLTQSGGIIEATNSSFINCGISLKPVYYNYASASLVRECSFSSTTLLDPGYGTSGPYQYPVNNPGFGYANPLQRTWAHIASANTRRIKFMDNTFANSEYGVYSVNSAHWYIDGNQNGIGNLFTGMTRAMRMDYYWSSVFGNRIEDNFFDNISAPVWLLSYGARGDVIKNNRFNTLNLTQQQNGFVALALAWSSTFKLVDNLFEKMGMGVWIYHSGPLGGLVGYESSGNVFNLCRIGERISGNNQSLQLRCNTHRNDNQSPTPYFLDWEVLNLNLNSTLANQGNFPALSDIDPAGNEFNQIFPTQFDEIWSNFAIFNYLHHDPNNGLSVVPGISPMPGQVLNTSNLISTPFLKNGGASCAPLTCPPPCPQRITLYNNQLLLEAEYNSTLSLIDGGNTSEVLGTISAGLAHGELKNYLLNHCPLSDEALLAFINLPDIPSGIFKEVILANSPISDNVRPALYSRISEMPPGISKQIRNAQYSTAIRTLTAIRRETESVKQRILFIDTDAMIYYAEQDSVSDAVNAIGAQNNFEASEVISATWLQEGNHANAASVLGSMTAVDPEDQDYLILQNMLLSLIQSGRSVFEMSAIEEQLVRTVAGRATPSLARTNARAILFYVFNEEFNDELDLNQALRIALSETVTEEHLTGAFIGGIFPNPSRGTISISYYLPDWDGGWVQITDMAGKHITKIIVKGGSGQLILPEGYLQPGVYIVNINGVGSGSKKLIIHQSK